MDYLGVDGHHGTVREEFKVMMMMMAVLFRTCPVAADDFVDDAVDDFVGAPQSVA